MKHAVVVLDETGSMAGQENRVVTSMNEYVAKLPKKARLTVFKFDSERWTEFYSGLSKNWKKMKEKDYKPGMMTPLYDAIAKGIKHAESISSKGDKVLMMIDTDGHENASKEHGQNSIKALVDKKKKAGWKFLFMAAGIDQAAATFVGTAGVKLGMVVNAASHTMRSSNYASAAGQTMTYFDDSAQTAGDDGDNKKEKDEPFWSSAGSKTSAASSTGA